jgi:hypothetical protein
MKGYIIKGLFIEEQYETLVKSKDIYDNTVYLNKEKAMLKINDYKEEQKKDGIYEDFVIDEVNVIE